MKVISGRRGCALRGWFLCLVVLLLIAGVTGWFVARAPGFREIAARRLSDATGLTIEIADSYVGWPYVLVLRGIRTTEAGGVDVEMREMRIGRRLWQWTLHVRGARIAFAPVLPEDSAVGVSRVLVRLAGLRDADTHDIMRATAQLQARWRLDFDDVDLVWLDADGEQAAYVRQVRFQMMPVQLPSETMYYYRVAYPGTAQNAFGSIRAVDWEWLTRGGDHYVELQRSGIVPPPMFFE